MKSSKLKKILLANFSLNVWGRTVQKKVYLFLVLRGVVMEKSPHENQNIFLFHKG
jgi:hypothetical protein